jgi:hypothetical protein
MISDRWMAHALNNSTANRRITAVVPPGSLLKRQHPCQPRDGAQEAAGRDVSASSSSLPAGVPVSAATSPASPPRLAPPPRPSDKPEDGGGQP